MKTKTISKVIVYYDDGTYEEVKVGISNAPNQPNTTTPVKTPVSPDFRPDWQKIREWNPSTPYQPTFVSPHTGDPSLPPWTITCGTTGQNLNWKVTSTGNAPLDYKYTITSTGNGNVDVSN